MLFKISSEDDVVVWSMYATGTPLFSRYAEQEDNIHHARFACTFRPKLVLQPRTCKSIQMWCHLWYCCLRKWITLAMVCLLCWDKKYLQYVMELSCPMYATCIPWALCSQSHQCLHMLIFSTPTFSWHTCVRILSRIELLCSHACVFSRLSVRSPTSRMLWGYFSRL